MEANCHLWNTEVELVPRGGEKKTTSEPVSILLTEERACQWIRDSDNNLTCCCSLSGEPLTAMSASLRARSLVLAIPLLSHLSSNVPEEAAENDPTHLRSPDGVSGSWLQPFSAPTVPATWGKNQHMEDPFSVSPFLYISLPFKQMYTT